MAQQFDCPKTETQLREILDNLYQQSKEVYDAGDALHGKVCWKSCQPKQQS